MIKIEKLNTPNALQDCQKEIQEELFRKKDTFKWQTNHYSDPIKSHLKELYFNKCGFCETILSEFDTDNKFTVEHFRPKSYYYWLGAEWTNLFPACKGCNGNKKDDFPLLMERHRFKKDDAPFDELGQLIVEKCHPAYYAAEQPLFCHPEIDAMMDWITFDTAGEAKMKQDLQLSIHQQEQIKKMFQKFMNRPIVQEKRKRCILMMQTRLVDTLNLILPMLEDGYSDKEIKLAFTTFFNDLSKMKRPESEFSLLGCCMNEKFDTFFLEYVENIAGKEIAKLVEYAYQLHFGV